VSFWLGFVVGIPCGALALIGLSAVMHSSRLSALGD
jgi:hypothetical protein